MTFPPRATITGTGSHLPEEVLTNARLEQMVDTSDEWILSRTGIRERRIAASDEAASDLGTRAACHALEAAGVDSRDVDVIICATITPDMPSPATACFIQHKLGADRAWAFDISAACSGFVYGMEIARSMIAAGSARRVLLIGTEVLSRIVDYRDRSTCILFGDGAGAVVMEPARDPRYGVLASRMYADGSGWEMINVPGGGSRTPASERSVRERMHFFRMQGRNLFKFVVRVMPDMVRELLAESDRSIDDIRIIIPHQVNYRIFKAAAERLGIPTDRIFMNLDRVGNTTAASVPIALDEVVRDRRLDPGDFVLFLGFGAGLTWGSMLVRWGR